MSRSHLSRWSGLVVAGLLLGAGAPAAAAQEQAVVTAAVQVTDNPDPVRAHSSPQLARNPETGELVVVEADVRGTLACNVHISVDDGRSWFPGANPMADAHPICAPGAEYGPYASMAFGADGVLYIAFAAGDNLVRGRDNTPRHLYLARSTDSGRTFDTTMVFEAPEGAPDKGLNKGPTLAVDPNDSDHVYVGWRQGVFRNATEKLKTNIAASTDGGKTFAAPVDVSDDRGGDYPWIAVDGSGDVHAVYWTRTGFPPIDMDEPAPVRPIRYVTSSDDGATWSEGKDIDPGNQGTQRPPVLAADPSSDALYVAWYSNAEPLNQEEGFEGDLDIFFRSSLDGGGSWSERTVLNDDEGSGSEAGQFFPGISIAPNGRVDVAWYDGRLSPAAPPGEDGGEESGFQDVFYTSSTDRGATFTPNLRISDRSIDRSVGVWSNNIDSSHNVGIDSSDEAVYFAWQDSRNADPELQAEDVYMASLQLEEAAASTSSVPGWAWLGAGTALGLGLAAVVAWLVARRSSPSSARGPATAVPSRT